jgi:hypothetical protein
MKILSRAISPRRVNEGKMAILASNRKATNPIRNSKNQKGLFSKKVSIFLVMLFKETED